MRKILAAVIGLVALTSHAAIPQAFAATEASRVVSLASLMAGNGTITLRDASGQYDLSLPLPSRRTPVKAKLHLELANSNVLIGHRSQLRVAVNGWHVAQIRLDPDNPQASVDINLPIDKLKSGYNVLRFTVAQHYTDDKCEDPGAPELWTEIDSVKSTLELTTVAADLNPTLADLGRLWEETLRDYEVQIVQLGPRKTDEQLGWGGLITQGIALRLRYAPFRVSLVGNAEAATAQADSVLIGKRDDLTNQLSEEVVRRIVGPYLAIARKPDQPGFFRLIVSGTNDAEVTQAAKAFTRLRFPFPDAEDTAVTKSDAVLANLDQVPGTLQPGQAYQLGQLGFTRQTFDSFGGKTYELQLRFPPDLYASEDAQVEIWLHVSFRAALRRDSVFNLLLNGNFERSVHLQEEAGADYRGYRLSIPLRSFQPGINVLRFEPYATPLITGECQVRQGHLYTTLYEDSVIKLPKADHFARLPDLALFAKTGFPLTAGADGSTASIRILDAAPASLATAWQVLAKLAQLQGAPLTGTQLTYDSPHDDRHVLSIGGIAAFQRLDQSGAPLTLGEINRLQMSQGLIFETPQGDWMQRLDRQLRGENMPTAASPVVLNLPMDFSAGPGAYRVLMAYPSTHQRGKLAMSLLAATPEELLDGAQRLMTPEYWYTLKGDLAVFKDTPGSLAWQDSGATLFVGDAPARLRWGAYFTRYPFYWLAGLLILLAVFSWVAHRLLNRFKRRHVDVRDFES